MTIKEFIEKAIGGGWKPKVTRIEYQKYFDNGYCEIFQDYYFLLDPKFWKAVGKVQYEKTWNRSSGLEKSIKSWSKLRMHEMIDHLCDGGTIESYLKTL